jgi:hypothetical protein
MARSRNIKPAFFQNEELAECPFETRLLFIGLWTIADREGRLEDRPKRIRAQLFPFDVIDVDPLLSDLASRGFIRRYMASGVGVVSIPTFVKHQNPHKNEVASTLPAEDSSHAPSDSGHAPSESGQNESTPEKARTAPADSLLPLTSSLNPSSQIGTESKIAKPPRARFTPPTLEQVRAYCAERGNKVDPQQWLDHYSANGWKVGKNAMVDWKAAVRTWEKNDSNNRTQPPLARMGNRVGPGQKHDPTTGELKWE